MELRLQKLIVRLLEIAHVRNITIDNPIKINLESPNSTGNVIVVVAYREPSSYPLPFNVTWIVADPSSPFYKQALKRVAKDSSPATPDFRHAWVQLYNYIDIFEPPQYFDEVDAPTAPPATAEELLAHLADRSNPHHTTASQVDCLPISGGVLLGNVELPPPTLPNHAVTRNYVDNKFAILFPIVSASASSVITLENSLADVSSSLYELQLRLAMLEDSAKTKTFVHEQTVPATSWVVDHFFNSSNVVLTVWQDGEQVIPDRVAVAPNTVSVDFATPAVGRVVLVILRGN